MKKFQKAIAVLLSLAMLLAFAACGASESAPAASGAGDPAPADNGGKTHIGVAYCTLAEEFAVDLQKGVQEKARELGVEISEVDYALDLSKGNDEVDNFIQMGVDAIILWPLDAAAFAGAGEKAAAAGIPVVTVDSTIDENVSCFIASDNRAGGKEAALYGLEAIGGKGKVLIITPAPGMTSLEDRCEGYYDALKDYPDVEVIEQMDPGTQARAGYAQTVENALNANPDVDLILANCGDCALGALSTVELYPDKFADVKIIGYDATPEQVKAMQEGRQIIASMAQNPMNIGSLAVESVQKILAGETVDAVVRTPGGLVTREEEMAKAAA
ncbi:sugar ABC transporter substrate-binding protein [Anaerotruncus massiliensis (ex Togo et al. 2019)]|uniref:sugar ABC transporter substrate-binding protein n=1 Tax=Anaerotruncus massiliensis (ex Togo et al. 2019) TaxID=1673720 RepID=UPI0027BAE6EB|nr:sugar ABC transporter substrate-binding protein [Anaerotruncus massiliensis (ex Togo et al. 2019)]